MEINFEDYLSDQERKQIVADVFRTQCIKEWEEDGGARLIGNIAYDTVINLVNKAINGDINELITTKTIEVINELSAFTVFYKADGFRDKDSVGRVALNEAVLNSKPLIQQRLKNVIESLDVSELAAMLKEEAVYLLDAKLFGSRVI